MDDDPDNRFRAAAASEPERPRVFGANREEGGAREGARDLGPAFSKGSRDPAFSRPATSSPAFNMGGGYGQPREMPAAFSQNSRQRGDQGHRNELREDTASAAAAAVSGVPGTRWTGRDAGGGSHNNPAFAQMRRPGERTMERFGRDTPSAPLAMPTGRDQNLAAFVHVQTQHTPSSSKAATATPTAAAGSRGNAFAALATETAAAAAPEKPTDAVAIAASVAGEAAARATLARKLSSVLDDFLTDMSKTAVKKVADALQGQSKTLLVEAVRLIAEKAFSQDKGGDRRTLAGLLNGLRTTKPTQGNVTVEVVGEGLAAFIAAAKTRYDAAVAAAAGAELDEKDAESAARARAVVEDMGKAKGGLAVTELPQSVQAYVAAVASLDDLAAAKAAKALKDIALDVAGAGAASSWGDSAAPSSEELAAAVTAVAASDPSEPAAKVASDVLDTGLKGKQLAAAAKTAFAGHAGRDAAFALMNEILNRMYTAKRITAAPSVDTVYNAENPNDWLAQKEFGALLASYGYEKPDGAVAILYAVQGFCHQHNFSKNVLPGLFGALYDGDCIDDASFFAWKEDQSAVWKSVEGRPKAVLNTQGFFLFLAEDEEEEEEEDPELAEALKGIARNVNATKPR